MLMRSRSGHNIPKMPNDLTALPLTESIPIPPVPTTFFPGATPASALLGKAGSIDTTVHVRIRR